MTKIIILGEQPTESKTPTPIEFVYCFGVDWNFLHEATCVATDFEYVELVARDFCSDKSRPTIKYDLMFAYDNPAKRNEGTLYLGHWNDGVV